MESIPLSGHVLVIEDDHSVQRVLELQLKSLGLEVSLASDGKEGFERARELEPDLILLDLMMPEMDGFQVLKRVKCIDFLAQVPVVILTASQSDRHRRKSMTHLADEYLTKPYTLQELRSTLERFLAASPKD